MRARRSIEIRTSGGCSETDMNAFAVIPCTCSPTRVVRTVTPVANIPSVRRKARDGSSVEVADVDLLRDRHVVERRVAEPCERAGREARQDELELLRRRRLRAHAAILPTTGGAAQRCATPPAEARRDLRRGRAHSARRLCSCPSGIVGVSSRQCGRSPSWTMRR